MAKSQKNMKAEKVTKQNRSEAIKRIRAKQRLLNDLNSGKLDHLKKKK